jgi:hypothetical protein
MLNLDDCSVCFNQTIPISLWRQLPADIVDITAFVVSCARGCISKMLRSNIKVPYVVQKMFSGFPDHI